MTVGYACWQKSYVDNPGGRMWCNMCISGAGLWEAHLCIVFTVLDSEVNGDYTSYMSHLSISNLGQVLDPGDEGMGVVRIGIS